MRRFESENQEMGGQKIREPCRKCRWFVSENQEMGGGRIKEPENEEVCIREPGSGEG